MALTVEDGSVVTGANSYATVAATQAYAASRGLKLPTTAAELAAFATLHGLSATPTADAAVEILLILAMDYLEAELRTSGQGIKTAKANPCQYPRSGVIVDGYAVDTDEIPACLVQAQMQLACDSYALDTLTPTSDGRVVTKERVEGAIEVNYADHGDNNPQPQLTAANKLIAPLLDSGLFGGAGVTVRV